ncbi:MAG: hypothetical protein HQL57_08840, partial [Magnetococcales bacterium]|nr:hypothetical protein [Magnetococcales bacterium]
GHGDRGGRGADSGENSEGVCTGENCDEFTVNIDNISESGAFYSVILASGGASPPFAVGETVLLKISIAGFFDREIFGAVTRGTQNDLFSGGIKFAYAIKFSWLAAPPAFVEMVRKTQAFITAEQRALDD